MQLFLPLPKSTRLRLLLFLLDVSSTVVMFAAFLLPVKRLGQLANVLLAARYDSRSIRSTVKGHFYRGITNNVGTKTRENSDLRGDTRLFVVFYSWFFSMSEDEKVDWTDMYIYIFVVVVVVLISVCDVFFFVPFAKTKRVFFRKLSYMHHSITGLFTSCWHFVVTKMPWTETNDCKSRYGGDSCLFAAVVLVVVQGIGDDSDHDDESDKDDGWVAPPSLLCSCFLFRLFFQTKKIKIKVSSATDRNGWALQMVKASSVQCLSRAAVRGLLLRWTCRKRWVSCSPSTHVQYT